MQKSSKKHQILNRMLTKAAKHKTIVYPLFKKRLNKTRKQKIA